MVSQLIKNGLKSFLVNKLTHVYTFNSVRSLNLIKRDTITKNEQDWIAENSKKLLENAKAEKGINLNIDPKNAQLYFDKSEELKTADEKVKKILSLEYATRADYKRYEEELIKKEFQQNPTENDSLEIQIALHTINIRRMCNNMEEFKNKNKRIKFFLFRQIHRRDRMMAQLFYKDHKRYEWLIEKLNLKDYHLKESYPYKRVTKYDKFIQEVEAKAEQQRNAKLETVKVEFENEKKDFFKQKENALNEIEKEIRELGFNVDNMLAHSNDKI